MTFLFTLYSVGCLVLLGAGVLEQRRHHRHLRGIPIRVVVNGIRGKSSVTRLCAGALRGEMTTVAKTTGTAARFIPPDGRDETIHRKFGLANIIEQVAVVTSRTWVRLLPQAWRAGAERSGWFRPWLDATIGDTSPDVLETAMQYTTGRPVRRTADGTPFRGDARFGLIDVDGDGVTESSDFYQYLERSWRFPDGTTAAADPRRARAVDCSGYIRLVYGYRAGVPLRNDDGPGPGLPRRAGAMARFSPGSTIVPDTGRRSTDYSRAQPGDLLFFNTEPDGRINHVAIYLGVDDSGHRRFIFSRGVADGPTMGDAGGTSVIDDGGHYSNGFRSVRRL